MSLYSVGMVMKHRKYNYHCVIFGWDPICIVGHINAVTFIRPFVAFEGPSADGCKV